MNRICFGLSLFVLLLMMPNVIAATIFVPDDFPTIQQAIDAASERDTIVVRDGVYYENLNVDKQLIIKSENGSARCIIDGRGKGNVVTLKADGITLEGFTIKNSGKPSSRWECYLWGGCRRVVTHYAGIVILYFSNNNTLTRNNIVDNDYGIRLVGSNNKITNNKILDNDYGIYLDYNSNNNVFIRNNIVDNDYGIRLVGSNNKITNNKFVNNGIVIDGYLENWITHVIENNTVNGKPIYYFKNKVGGIVPSDAGQVILANCTGMITENLIIKNTDIGILLGYSHKNVIRNCKILDSHTGIYLNHSSNNKIIGNNISNNFDGIHLLYSGNNIILLNNISNNNYGGIHLYYSGNTKIIENNIVDNGIYYNSAGIFLDFSEICEITRNNISKNGRFGIDLQHSKDNVIYLNNFDNTENIDTDYYSINHFNSSKPITYQYNGKTYTNYLGNHWSDYKGLDNDNNGIGDVPYIMNKNNKDYYPLMQQFENYLTTKQ